MLYNLWLHAVLGYSSRNIRGILKAFGSAEALFSADIAEIRESGLFSARELESIARKDLAAANRIAERCGQLGYSVFCIDDDDYPSRLAGIKDPPAVIFTLGDNLMMYRRSAAIVGARKPTLTGKKTAFEMAYKLASEGVVVVSGGADGIDTQAHKGALQSGGFTVCVLGGGINHRYLSKNAPLRQEIARHGLLVSEYPPDMEPASYTFPRRNRIISALSNCTVVVEASMGSGSLITAADAREQGRLLFAVPGSLDSESSSGTNKLLAEGAFAAVSAEDIIRRMNEPSSRKEIEIDSRTISGIRQEGKLRASREKSNKPQERRHPVMEDGSPEKKPENKAVKFAGSRRDKSSQDNLLNINEKNEIISEKQEKDDNFLNGMLTENALTVYHTIPETPFLADSLTEVLDMEISEVLSALTELEILGLIRAVPGSRYERI